MRDENARAAMSAAGLMRYLDSGPLAELRRLDPDTGATSAPMFWRLASRHPETIGAPRNRGRWMAIVRLLAILTRQGASPLHNSGRPLGVVLCDGGQPSWPGSGRPSPFFSEQRLLQLAGARGPQRAVLLDRAVRMLASSMMPGSGVNVPEIAFCLLEPHRYGDRLLAPYYNRLDSAQFARTSSETGE